QPETRECYQRLLGRGWTDALDSLYPGQRIYTFWDYFRQHWKTNSGLRIDHLLLSPQLTERLTGGGVDLWVRDEPKASDHAPTWVDLSIERYAIDSQANRRRMRRPLKRPAASLFQGEKGFSGRR